MQSLLPRVLRHGVVLRVQIVQKLSILPMSNKCGVIICIYFFTFCFVTAYYCLLTTVIFLCTYDLNHYD